MTDTITISNGPHELAWQPLDEAFGVSREVARPTPGLLVFRDTRGDQQILIAETTENRADAPATLDYVLTVNGVRCECKGHKRLRRTWWLISGTYGVGGTELIQPNDFAWDGVWGNVAPMSLGGIVPAGGGTADTGPAPEHGIYPAWSRVGGACIQTGKVHGHLPMALRDVMTLEPIRDTKVTMGFNPKNVLGVSVTTLGNKADTSHAWSPLPAYLAAKGTVLERFYAECMEFTAIHAILSDYPGLLWKKQPRGQGRSLRNVVDWIDVASAYGDTLDEWCVKYLAEAQAYYREREDSHLSIERGIRVGAKSNRRCVAGFEWAQLLYGIWKAEELLKFQSDFVPNALNWFARVAPNGMPYEINLSDSGGATMPLWPEERIISEEYGASLAEPTRYDRFWPEDYILNWLRHQLGLPLTRPLDDPKYLAALNTSLSAGFHLPWVPKPKWETDGKVFDNIDAVRSNARYVLGTALDAWDGTTDFEATVKIVRR